MNRRSISKGIVGLLPLLAGCLGSSSMPSTAPANSTEIELVDPEIEIDAPPEVSVNDNTVVVRGTVEYGSSSCGTVKLAHAEYEASQDRLDLLVVAGDDSGERDACTDDLRASGYRVEATVDEQLRRIATTEHHVFGDTYSTTTDLSDY